MTFSSYEAKIGLLKKKKVEKVNNAELQKLTDQMYGNAELIAGLDALEAE